MVSTNLPLDNPRDGQAHRSSPPPVSLSSERTSESPHPPLSPACLLAMPTAILIRSALYRAGMSSPDRDRAPPYSVAGTSRHILSSGQLPPLDGRPSSPVILPSFNDLNAIIRNSSPPQLLTRHPQNGSISSGPHLKVWKSENMATDQQSASSTLAGQQLNVPAPSLPTSYPG
jgi:hypothetical protein